MRRIFFGICVVMFFGVTCGAQQAAVTSPSIATAVSGQASPELDALAALIAHQIEKKHLKSVVVIGAVGRDASKLTQDGQEIGDQISAALTNRAKGFQVVDRGTLRDFLKKNGISEAMAVSDALAAWVARISNVSGYVVIQIGEVSNGKAKIAANLYRADLEDVTSLGTTKTELELSDEQKRVGLLPLNSDWNRPTITIEDGKKLPPDRSPKCTSCPPPEFLDSIRHSVGRNGDETVGMYVTVFPDGKPGEIAVVKPGPFGMSQIAVGTILRKWQFTPAVDGDGKPIAFRINVEVRYQIH